MVIIKREKSLTSLRCDSFCWQNKMHTFFLRLPDNLRLSSLFLGRQSLWEFPVQSFGCSSVLYLPRRAIFWLVRRLRSVRKLGRSCLIRIYLMLKECIKKFYKGMIWMAYEIKKFFSNLKFFLPLCVLVGRYFVFFVSLTRYCNVRMGRAALGVFFGNLKLFVFAIGPLLSTQNLGLVRHSWRCPTSSFSILAGLSKLSYFGDADSYISSGGIYTPLEDLLNTNSTELPQDSGFMQMYPVSWFDVPELVRFSYQGNAFFSWYERFFDEPSLKSYLQGLVPYFLQQSAQYVHFCAGKYELAPIFFERLRPLLLHYIQAFLVRQLYDDPLLLLRFEMPGPQQDLFLRQFFSGFVSFLVEQSSSLDLEIVLDSVALCQVQSGLSWFSRVDYALLLSNRINSASLESFRYLDVVNEVFLDGMLHELSMHGLIYAEGGSLFVAGFNLTTLAFSTGPIDSRIATFFFPGLIPGWAYHFYTVSKRAKDFHYVDVIGELATMEHAEEELLVRDFGVELDEYISSDDDEEPEIEGAGEAGEWAVEEDIRLFVKTTIRESFIRRFLYRLTGSDEARSLQKYGLGFYPSRHVDSKVKEWFREKLIKLIGDPQEISATFDQVRKGNYLNDYKLRRKRIKLYTKAVTWFLYEELVPSNYEDDGDRALAASKNKHLFCYDRQARKPAVLQTAMSLVHAILWDISRFYYEWDHGRKEFFDLIDTYTTDRGFYRYRMRLKHGYVVDFLEDEMRFDSLLNQVPTSYQTRGAGVYFNNAFKLYWPLKKNIYYMPHFMERAVPTLKSSLAYQLAAVGYDFDSSLKQHDLFYSTSPVPIMSEWLHHFEGFDENYAPERRSEIAMEYLEPEGVDEWVSHDWQNSMDLERGLQDEFDFSLIRTGGGEEDYYHLFWYWWMAFATLKESPVSGPLVPHRLNWLTEIITRDDDTESHPMYFCGARLLTLAPKQTVAMYGGDDWEATLPFTSFEDATVDYGQLQQAVSGLRSAETDILGPFFRQRSLRGRVLAKLQYNAVLVRDSLSSWGHLSSSKMKNSEVSGTNTSLLEISGVPIDLYQFFTGPNSFDSVQRLTVLRYINAAGKHWLWSTRGFSLPKLPHPGAGEWLCQDWNVLSSNFRTLMSPALEEAYDYWQTYVEAVVRPRYLEQVDIFARDGGAHYARMSNVSRNIPFETLDLLNRVLWRLTRKYQSDQERALVFANSNLFPDDGTFPIYPRNRNQVIAYQEFDVMNKNPVPLSGKFTLFQNTCSNLQLRYSNARGLVRRASSKFIPGAIKPTIAATDANERESFQNAIIEDLHGAIEHLETKERRSLVVNVLRRFLPDSLLPRLLGSADQQGSGLVRHVPVLDMPENLVSQMVLYYDLTYRMVPNVLKLNRLSSRHSTQADAIYKVFQNDWRLRYDNFENYIAKKMNLSPGLFAKQRPFIEIYHAAVFDERAVFLLRYNWWCNEILNLFTGTSFFGRLYQKFFYYFLNFVESSAIALYRLIGLTSSLWFVISRGSFLAGVPLYNFGIGCYQKALEHIVMLSVPRFATLSENFTEWSFSDFVTKPGQFVRQLTSYSINLLLSSVEITWGGLLARLWKHSLTLEYLRVLPQRQEVLQDLILRDWPLFHRDFRYELFRSLALHLWPVGYTVEGKPWWSWSGFLRSFQHWNRIFSWIEDLFLSRRDRFGRIVTKSFGKTTTIAISKSTQNVFLSNLTLNDIKNVLNGGLVGVERPSDFSLFRQIAQRDLLYFSGQYLNGLVKNPTFGLGLMLSRYGDIPLQDDLQELPVLVDVLNTAESILVRGLELNYQYKFRSVQQRRLFWKLLNGFREYAKQARDIIVPRGYARDGTVSPVGSYTLSQIRSQLENLELEHDLRRGPVFDRARFSLVDKYNEDKRYQKEYISSRAPERKEVPLDSTLEPTPMPTEAAAWGDYLTLMDLHVSDSEMSNMFPGNWPMYEYNAIGFFYDIVWLFQDLRPEVARVWERPVFFEDRAIYDAGYDIFLAETIPSDDEYDELVMCDDEFDEMEDLISEVRIDPGLYYPSLPYRKINLVHPATGQWELWDDDEQLEVTVDPIDGHLQQKDLKTFNDAVHTAFLVNYRQVIQVRSDIPRFLNYYVVHGHFPRYGLDYFAVAKDLLLGYDYLSLFGLPVNESSPWSTQVLSVHPALPMPQRLVPLAQAFYTINATTGLAGCPGATRYGMRSYLQRILASAVNPSIELSEMFLSHFSQFEPVQRYFEGYSADGKPFSFNLLLFEEVFPGIQLLAPERKLMPAPFIPTQKQVYNDMLSTYLNADPQRRIGVLYDVNLTPSPFMEWIEMCRTKDSVWLTAYFEFHGILWFRLHGTTVLGNALGQFFTSLVSFSMTLIDVISGTLLLVDQGSHIAQNVMNLVDFTENSWAAGDGGKGSDFWREYNQSRCRFARLIYDYQDREVQRLKLLAQRSSSDALRTRVITQQERLLELSSNHRVSLARQLAQLQQDRAVVQLRSPRGGVLPPELEFPGVPISWYNGPSDRWTSGVQLPPVEAFSYAWSDMLWYRVFKNIFHFFWAAPKPKDKQENLRLIELLYYNGPFQMMLLGHRIQVWHRLLIREHFRDCLLNQPSVLELPQPSLPLSKVLLGFDDLIKLVRLENRVEKVQTNVLSSWFPGARRVSVRRGGLTLEGYLFPSIPFEYRRMREQFLSECGIGQVFPIVGPYILFGVENIDLRSNAYHGLLQTHANNRGVSLTLGQMLRLWGPELDRMGRPRGPFNVSPWEEWLRAIEQVNVSEAIAKHQRAVKNQSLLKLFSALGWPVNGRGTARYKVYWHGNLQLFCGQRRGTKEILTNIYNGIARQKLCESYKSVSVFQEFWHKIQRISSIPRQIQEASRRYPQHIAFPDGGGVLQQRPQWVTRVGEDRSNLDIRPLLHGSYSNLKLTSSDAWRARFELERTLLSYLHKGDVVSFVRLQWERLIEARSALVRLLSEEEKVAVMDNLRYPRSTLIGMVQYLEEQLGVLYKKHFQKFDQTPENIEYLVHELQAFFLSEDWAFTALDLKDSGSLFVHERRNRATGNQAPYAYPLAASETVRPRLTLRQRLQLPEEAQREYLSKASALDTGRHLLEALHKHKVYRLSRAHEFKVTLLNLLESMLCMERLYWESGYTRHFGQILRDPRWWRGSAGSALPIDVLTPEGYAIVKSSLTRSKSVPMFYQFNKYTILQNPFLERYNMWHLGIFYGMSRGAAAHASNVPHKLIIRLLNLRNHSPLLVGGPLPMMDIASRRQYPENLNMLWSPLSRWSINDANIRMEICIKEQLYANLAQIQQQQKILTGTTASEHAASSKWELGVKPTAKLRVGFSQVKVPQMDSFSWSVFFCRVNALLVAGLTKPQFWPELLAQSAASRAGGSVHALDPARFFDQSQSLERGNDGGHISSELLNRSRSTRYPAEVENFERKWVEFEEKKGAHPSTQTPVLERPIRHGSVVQHYFWPVVQPQRLTDASDLWRPNRQHSSTSMISRPWALGSSVVGLRPRPRVPHVDASLSLGDLVGSLSGRRASIQESLAAVQEQEERRFKDLPNVIRRLNQRYPHLQYSDDRYVRPVSSHPDLRLPALTRGQLPLTDDIVAGIPSLSRQEIIVHYQSTVES